MLEKKIADSIRQIWNNKEITLAQLGEETRLCKGLLSRIENNQVSPPIATLCKIAHGLKVPISIFFEEESEKEEYALTRKNEQKTAGKKGYQESIPSPV
jgi:transcriptional regulator with XRE-family HTH domain